MNTGSPSAYLLWAILSCIFLCFLILHLWFYDRFNCVKWDSGRQPGAFKRVMTYSYLATLPLLVCFSVAMTTIKFQEGYILAPGSEMITPRPFDKWSPKNKNYLLPLLFTLSIAWSLELVTHLEELTFWLFLLHQGPGKRDWFHSWEFRTWYLGSIIAVLGMPVTTLITRHQLNTGLAWIFLAGSSAGTSTTICFLYVLFRFPAFLEYVKAEGADPGVVVRLTNFYQLNCIRVAFRFCFTIPLLLLAADSIKGPFPVLRNQFAVEFLLMMAGIGCFISSGITLLIFFPRSVAQESGYRAKIISPQTSTKPAEGAASQPPEFYYDHHHYDHAVSNPMSVLGSATSPPSRMNFYRFPKSPMPTADRWSRQHERRRRDSTEIGDVSLGYDSDAESIAMTSQTVQSHPIQHSISQPGHSRGLSSRGSGTGKSDDTVWDGQLERPPSLRRHSDGSLIYQRSGKIHRIDDVEERSSQVPLRRREGSSQLHPYVMNFTSPIDLLDGRDDDRVPTTV